jgi:hypothetical protein
MSFNWGSLLHLHSRYFWKLVIFWLFYRSFPVFLFPLWYCGGFFFVCDLFLICEKSYCYKRLI